MKDNYRQIAKKNLQKLYDSLSPDLPENLPCEKKGDELIFKAFGKQCCISPKGIILDNTSPPSPVSILISLYAIGASKEPCIEKPFKAFKEFPNTMPYVGAFTSHTEMPLVPNVPFIKKKQDIIKSKLNGTEAPAGTNGDLSFVLYPLPKIALCYIFYEADEDFEASATCLFSSNANSFLSVDGLADVGEYTSKAILEISNS